MKTAWDYIEEARELGELAAWVDNREMELGVIGKPEIWAWDYVEESFPEIAEALGEEAADEAFAEGYDATIDFSLNTNWRYDDPPTAEAAEDDPNSLEW